MIALRLRNNMAAACVQIIVKVKKLFWLRERIDRKAAGLILCFK